MFSLVTIEHILSLFARGGYFLRKSLEIDDNARRMDFDPLLCLAEASGSGRKIAKLRIWSYSI
jgi:hypothetical protein